jgi:hypothetical protein
VHLKFSRIQFTPDLMPSDIIGTEVIEEDRATGSRGIRFMPGPIFANIILADEINRTPPKTQAALLEAMQEYQVTVGGVRHELVRPLFVLATQNPIEQEGTYPASRGAARSLHAECRHRLSVGGGRAHDPLANDHLARSKGDAGRDRRRDRARPDARARCGRG